MDWLQQQWLLYVALGMPLLSGLSFFGYHMDKRRARLNSTRAGEERLSRLPEASLLSLDMLGGWPGGLIARRRYRHKTTKLSYRFAFGLNVLLNAVVLAAWGLAAFTGGGPRGLGFGSDGDANWLGLSALAALLGLLAFGARTWRAALAVTLLAAAVVQLEIWYLTAPIVTGLGILVGHWCGLKGFGNWIPAGARKKR